MRWIDAARPAFLPTFAERENDSAKNDSAKNDSAKKLRKPPAGAGGLHTKFVIPRCTGRIRSDLLDLDLDVDAGREVETLERVDRLGRGINDVEETLVDAHLEMLAGVLVLVR